MFMLVSYPNTRNRKQLIEVSVFKQQSLMMIKIVLLATSEIAIRD